jgi:hypothetical protein
MGSSPSTQLFHELIEAQLHIHKEFFVKKIKTKLQTRRAAEERSVL